MPAKSIRSHYIEREFSLVRKPAVSSARVVGNSPEKQQTRWFIPPIFSLIKALGFNGDRQRNTRKSNLSIRIEASLNISESYSTVWAPLLMNDESALQSNLFILSFDNFAFQAEIFSLRLSKNQIKLKQVESILEGIFRRKMVEFNLVDSLSRK